MPTNNSWNSQNPAQVEKGGTGRDTLVDHGLLVGSGVNPVNTIVYGGAANGIPLVSVAGADPNFGIATVPGGGTGNMAISAFCPVTGGGTNQAPLQTVSPIGAQPGYVLTYTGTSGNPNMPVWAAQSGGGGGGFTNCAFQVSTMQIDTYPNNAITKIGMYTIDFDTANAFVLPSSYFAPRRGIYFLYIRLRVYLHGKLARSFLFDSNNINKGRMVTSTGNDVSSEINMYFTRFYNIGDEIFLSIYTIANSTPPEITTFELGPFSDGRFTAGDPFPPVGPGFWGGFLLTEIP